MDPQSLEPDSHGAACWPRRPFAVDCAAWTHYAPRLATRIESALAAGCVAVLGLDPALRSAMNALEITLPSPLPPGPEVGGPEAMLWVSA